MLDKNLFFFDFETESQETLLDTMSEILLGKNLVKATYPDALKDREKEFPTGLPVKFGVAIPHTSIEHVNENKLVFVKPTKSVPFNEMGNESNEIDVSLVIFILIKDRENHIQVLSTIIEIIQDEEFLDTVNEATTEQEFYETISGKFDFNLKGEI